MRAAALAVLGFVAAVAGPTPSLAATAGITRSETA
jgi:hypothetical protein